MDVSVCGDGSNAYTEFHCVSPKLVAFVVEDCK